MGSEAKRHSLHRRTWTRTHTQIIRIQLCVTHTHTSDLTNPSSRPTPLSVRPPNHPQAHFTASVSHCFTSSRTITPHYLACCRGVRLHSISLKETHSNHQVNHKYSICHTERFVFVQIASALSKLTIKPSYFNSIS